VLDHVERRRVLEQPARKDAFPGRIGAGRGAFGDQHLNEGPGFGRHFPRRGALAGREPDDHIADPLRFARLDLDVLGKVVALVEQAELGDAFLTRRAEALVGADRCGEACEVPGNLGLLAFGHGFALAGGEEREGSQGTSPAHRQASGVQAS